MKKKKRKKSGLKRFLLFVAVVLIVVLGGWYLLLGRLYGKMAYQEAEGFTKEPWKEADVTNILLIGSDSRENVEGSRSDAMILLTISSRTKKISMTSLLRDIYVEIPGHEGNRLNAAYAYGGPELLMETINQNFDISVSRYVLVNFEAFANLVDAVGGVELSLTSEELEYVNAYLVEYNMLTNRPEGTDYMDVSMEGQVHLNGPQALAYSRNRYIGTDFGRTERQRKVLSEVLGKLPGALLTNPSQLMDGLLPNLTTNLTLKECYALSLQGGRLLSWEIEQGSVPVEGTYQPADIRGMSVLQIDFDANKRYLHDIMYGD
ncbi:MAG: LCP family protein [Bacillota bacterium]|nr:LCP family protein [Bacillota bacterium]